jgi:4-carboxymuconolactone decarboxylase
MNDLNHRERELAAFGAAVGSNCISCIEYHIPEARWASLTDSQIAEAIRLSDKVRSVPTRKVLDSAMRMLTEPSAGTHTGGSSSVETAEAAQRAGRAAARIVEYIS